jgi:hypothetical protein
LIGIPAYDTNQIRGVIENLEFLTHKSNREGAKMLNEEGPNKQNRINKMSSLVEIAN